MAYRVKELADILRIPVTPGAENILLKELIYDSRRIVNPESSLFIALTAQRDGHSYIHDAWKAGVRVFLVNKGAGIRNLPGAVFLEVEDTLAALQEIAAAHRHNFEFPVIGITGSNGKTTVKEWLFHLLSADFNIVRSPKSFNSQIGVALSVWQAEKKHHLGIFEAGISRKGEMEALRKMIAPQVGIFTGIGSAHDEGFTSLRYKIREKLLLFEDCHTLVFPADQPELEKEIFHWAKHRKIHLFGWSKTDADSPYYIAIHRKRDSTTLEFKGVKYKVPFTDEGSVDNACSCLLTLEALSFSPEKHREKFADLPPIDMRLQLKRGIFNTQLINDSYSADMTSLEIALDFLAKQAGNNKKILILSQLRDTGKTDKELDEGIKNLVDAHGVQRLVLVGKSYFIRRPLLAASTEYYETTAALLAEADWKTYSDASVLIKGSRDFAFEKIARRLEEKLHETVLEIDLNALEGNFKYFRSRLKRSTKVMAMVKAHGYGSGTHEIAYQLQSAGLDYLSVAYADEGIELRKKGISLPIMVMNAQRENLAAMLDYALEPAIYDFQMLEQLIHTLEETGITSASIHLEFDTGMHRLGFKFQELPELVERLAGFKNIIVKSVFSHLAASDQDVHDAFTRRQINDFEEVKKVFKSLTGLDPLFHILNTGGILRFPEAQLDMVRLGIGLYGVDPGGEVNPALVPVATLRAGISQVHDLAAGETVGYSRKGKLEKESRIAVITLGYADGFRRILSNGKGHVWIKGKLAPVVGNVCMDMTMVDVTDIDCREGDPVEIFGRNRRIEELAVECETIPYEIITGIASRVKRVYWHE